jgi:hypothetical protein
LAAWKNAPTGCGSDLLTILRILKNKRKSRSVNNLLQPPDLDPNRIKDIFYQPKLRPVDYCKDQRIHIPGISGALSGLGSWTSLA